MRRYSVLLQVFCVLMLVFTVSSESHAAQTQRAVFYLTIGSTITTYNVNGSGVPTQVGTPLTISGAHINYLVPAPNDRFLYVYWSDRANDYFIYTQAGMPGKRAA
jgi:hypothetical protein